jgi:hypothetical protein
MVSSISPMVVWAELHRQANRIDSFFGYLIGSSFGDVTTDGYEITCLWETNQGDVAIYHD